MTIPSPPIIDYRPTAPTAYLATLLLRSWAVLNWLGTLLAVAIVTFLVCWPSARAFNAGDALPGMIVYTLAGSLALFCIGWGVLCWSLGNAVAAADLRCARLALILTTLMAIGSAASIGGLYVLRHSFGAVRWTGTEGMAWRVLFAFDTPFIVGCVLTFLVLRRVLAFENRPRSA